MRPLLVGDVNAVRDVLRPVLPLVKESVRVAADAHDSDDFNHGTPVFGFVLWANLIRRLSAACREKRVELDFLPGNRDRWFNFERFHFRFHRVHPETFIPSGAVAAKQVARLATDRYSQTGLFQGVPSEYLNLIVGIVAGPFSGLERVMVGEMVRIGGTEKYTYEGDQPYEIYSSGRKAVGTAEDLIPEEDLPEAEVTLKEPPIEEPPVVPVTKVETQKNITELQVRNAKR